MLWSTDRGGANRNQGEGTWSGEMKVVGLGLNEQEGVLDYRKVEIQQY